MDFSTMDTNILAVIISSLIYVFFAILNWCRQKIVIWYTNKKMFKTYKKYATECLEKLIYYYKNKKIIYDVNPDNKKEYNLEELNFRLSKDDNTTSPSSSIDSNKVISIFLSFIAERELLDEKEQTLLCGLLSKMNTIRWLSIIQHKSNQPAEINRKILYISILAHGTSLSFSDSVLYRVTLDNVTLPFVEDMLTKLKNEKFDDRIRKIIKNNNL